MEQSNWKLHILFLFAGVQELFRRGRLQAGVPADADLQPHRLQVGEESGGKVRVRRHLCQGLPGTSAQGQRSLC